jgi:hypothetical protein
MVISTCLRVLRVASEGDGKIVPDASLEDVAGLLDDLDTGNLNRLTRVSKATHEATRDELARRKREFTRFLADLEPPLARVRQRILAELSRHAGGRALAWHGPASVLDSPEHQRAKQFIAWNLRAAGSRPDASLAFLRADYGENFGITVELYARTPEEIAVLATYGGPSPGSRDDFIRRAKGEGRVRWSYWPRDDAECEGCRFITERGGKAIEDERLVVDGDFVRERDVDTFDRHTYEQGIGSDVVESIAALFASGDTYTFHVPREYVRVGVA